MYITRVFVCFFLQFFCPLLNGIHIFLELGKLSRGGGGGGNDLKWGRDEDEDNRAWALRCMKMASRMWNSSVASWKNSCCTVSLSVYREFACTCTEQRTAKIRILDGVVVPRTGSGNWFVSVTGGATAFLGTPLGCEDLFGRVKPSYNLAVGKWFTPAVNPILSLNTV